VVAGVSLVVTEILRVAACRRVGNEVGKAGLVKGFVFV
jgi:hypothetical protein